MTTHDERRADQALAEAAAAVRAEQLEREARHCRLQARQLAATVREMMVFADELMATACAIRPEGVEDVRQA